jgi:hypothetical protein
MPLESVTGESIYAEEVFYVTPEILISKRFPMKDSIYPNSMLVAWNGLIVSRNDYTIASNYCEFDGDFPLAVADQIICSYTIGA